jgi:acetyltransferase-like isoleucine patch superfamily enzyme
MIEFAKMSKNYMNNGGYQNIIDFNEEISENVKITVIGNNNIIKCDPSARLSNLQIVISGDYHKIIIGEYCDIKSGTLWIEDNHCTIIIGKKTTIYGAGIAATEPNSIIEIGERCLFAYDIDIRCGDSHSIIDLQSGKRINYAKNIKIGNHVWIGAFVRILKGVQIGDESVVGIAAVVTKNVPRHCVVAGNPARVVKENIRWTEERIL